MLPVEREDKVGRNNVLCIAMLLYLLWHRFVIGTDDVESTQLYCYVSSLMIHQSKIIAANNVLISTTYTLHF